MRSKRFVLDANIWVSYFISNQQDVITEIIFRNKISIIYCTELITEISRVLNYPHLAKRNVNIKEAVLFIRQIGVFYNLQYPIKNYIPEDQDDNYIIALALQTNAGFVTSGDKHILSQKESLQLKYPKLQIISKSVFEEMFA